MDTSKEYILMCEKATEIQGFQPQHMSGYCSRETQTFHTDIYGQWWSGNTWLPRQDQLQAWDFSGKIAMIDGHAPLEWLLDAFYYWSRYEQRVSQTLNSMEKLWLAFVMEKIYRKYWIDGEWTTALSVDSKLVKWVPPDGVVGAW
mgnify:CR=1 FL=1